MTTLQRTSQLPTGFLRTHTVEEASQDGKILTTLTPWCLKSPSQLCGERQRSSQSSAPPDIYLKHQAWQWGSRSHHGMLRHASKITSASELAARFKSPGKPGTWRECKRDVQPIISHSLTFWEARGTEYQQQLADGLCWALLTVQSCLEFFLSISLCPYLAFFVSLSRNK